MESLPRSLGYELPHDLHYDKDALPKILDTDTNNIVGATNIVNLASTPTITTLDSVTANEFLQKLGATLLNSIHLQNYQSPKSSAADSPASSVLTSSSSSAAAAAAASSAASSSVVASSLSSSLPSFALPNNMDFDFAANHLFINGTSTGNFDPFDELQKQLEYDKLMNEVWIGIVFTLILISVVFCICSCFLYHQFRAWKRSYHNTVAQANDIESAKYNFDLDDPVPEYTLVSGLPSYEAALEVMKKTQKPCLLVYPSVYNIFTQNEKQPANEEQSSQINSQTEANNECTTPLLTHSSPATTPQAEKLYIHIDVPSYEEATKPMSTMTTKPSNLENKEKMSSSTITSTTTTTTTTTTTANGCGSPTTPSSPMCAVSQVPFQKPSTKSSQKS